MKHRNRFLAALLTAMMLCAALCGPMVAAEGIVLEDGGEILPAQGAAEDGLEVDMEALPEMPEMSEDLGLGLGDDMALSGELDLAGDESIDGGEETPREAGQAEPAGNDSSDFEIKNGVLVKYKGVGGDVVIPDGVTGIGPGAFSQCEGLVTVSIPEGVTVIGDLAFSECTNLLSVNMPSGVERIGSGAFWNCKYLFYFDIPKSVSLIGEGAFMNCLNLPPVTIPDGVTCIEPYTFAACHIFGGLLFRKM